jgi:23S rRNA (cytosine1962-C5)-methyltransferase
MIEISEIEDIVCANLADCNGDACRLLHGRGRSVPGWEQLSIDYFHPLILITVFEEFETSWLAQLAGKLQQWGRLREVEAIALQSRYSSNNSELQVLWGKLPRKPVAREAGLDFGLQLEQRQNIGFFLDMAQARHWLRQRSAGKRVLNLFAYTCAFSVAACAGGASRVVNLDMSSAALRLGQQNHQRNGFSTGVSYLAHNLFKSWSKLRRSGPFDIVVVDPPSRQRGSFVAQEDYGKVLSKLAAVCAADADVLLCLNSPHLESIFLMELAAEHAPQLEFRQRLENPRQFVDENVELSLKVLWFSYREITTETASSA